MSPPRLIAILILLCNSAIALAAGPTVVSIAGTQWQIDGAVTYPGTRAEGLLMNVRMVNAAFEDRKQHPEFDPDANTDRFIARIPDYAAQGVRAFTICLQGGMPGYEGALNSAFEPNGALRDEYMRRVQRIIDACDRQGMVVILGCYYQRQSKVLADEAAVRRGLINVVNWLRATGAKNVLLEVANEYPIKGFVHPVIRSPEGMAGLIRLARQTWPQLLIGASGVGDGKSDDSVAEASDFVLVHFNSTPVSQIPARLAALKKFGKPIVCNEDDKSGADAASAADACVAHGVSYGLMLEKLNQHYPFAFNGPADDPIFYAKLKALTTASNGKKPEAHAAIGDYFPPPESQGGWRKLDKPEDIRALGGMDPAKLEELKQWLMASDKRNFAAVVIRHGYICLEVECANSAKTDSRRVASCSKAVCATVLAIASDQSQRGLTPRKMSFDDPAFGFIPWAQPLSDPRKAKITVRQLLNHTSGICPEATGAPNDGTWDYILGHSGDARTARLAFDPGTACGYSTIAFDHASLVCETVTGKPYDQFAIEALFKPLGIEHWWFQYYDGPPKYGRHPSHGLGMPARDLARICYCMLHNGQWNDKQVIPKWFVEQTGGSSHNVKTPELRWKFNPQNFVLGWERPWLLTGEGGRSGAGIPSDARAKPGSGGQYIAFVPSLDLVITRQTGSTGEWAFEEYLRRACAASIDSH